MVVEIVDVEVVFWEVDFVVGVVFVFFVVILRLVFVVDVDVEVVRVDVEVDVVVDVVVVVEVDVDVSVDVLASGMAVRNRIAELIVWKSDIEFWASPWKKFNEIQVVSMK